MIDPIHNLLEDLKKAEKLLAMYTGGYSGSYLSAEEFHQDFVESLKKLEAGDMTAISDLWIWFAPTFEWDDFGRDVNLGEKIYQQLCKLNP